MKNSHIEWTDHTFNPWMGCTKVSPGCEHCYAKTMMDDRYGKVKWGPQGARIRTSAAYWRRLLKWNREAATTNIRRRVFCASLADVFEDKPDQPMLNVWRHELYDLIDATPHLDWLLLTKRPENVMQMIPPRWVGRLASNVWIGTSIENQEQADIRIPHLLNIPAAVRFLSVEPLLEQIDLYDYTHCPGSSEYGRGFNRTIVHAGGCCERHAASLWVIVGGESGPNARPLRYEWVTELRDQCQAAGVPFFFKQWGEYAQSPSDGIYTFGTRVGKKRAGRLLDGREWNEFPVVTEAM